MSTTTDDAPRRTRASRMPPEERRAAIIAATIPLVRAHGYAVTTRQIADAAGVAEGTLFRVFEDKEALVQAAICAALEPIGLDETIAAIDRSLPVRVRLLQVAALLQQRLRDVFELLTAAGLTAPPGRGPDGHAENGRPRRPVGEERVIHEIEALIEPDRDAFRFPTAEVARLLRVLTFAGSHQGITGEQPMTPDEIVSVLLDGVLDRSAPSAPPSA